MIPKIHRQAKLPILARFRRSRWRVVVQSFALAGMILQPVPMARSYWTDTNNDGVKDWVADPDPVNDAAWFTEDSDVDGLTNGEEVIYGSDPYRLDSDFDGLTDKDERDLTPLNDPWTWSSDGSGYSDHDRYYQDLQGTPLVVNYNTLTANSQPFYSYLDADGDGIQNQDDPDPLNFDRDGDGILNWQDAYMDDPNNGATPPDTTTDTDGDGIPDYSDPFPNGSYIYNNVEYGGTFTDADGDSIPDPLDPFPNGSYVYNGTEYGGTLIDSDNDGIPDPFDLFPNGSYWYEGVEYAGGMIDSDNDGIPDPFDSFPNGSYTYNGVEYAGAWIDSDNDGIPDAFDTTPEGYTYNGVFYSGTWADSDNDGIPDPADVFPNGSYVYLGTEYPGYWADQDNDGIPDPQDAFPTLPGSFWYGGVEYGGSWADTDGDGVPDPADPWPSIGGSYTYNNVAYPGTWADADSDGIPDPADPFPAGSYTYNGIEYACPLIDSDGDGVPDPADTFPQTAGSYWYIGTEYAGTWADSDGDTIPDPVDAYPNNKWNGQPYFTYNGVEYAGTWNDRDNDSVPDPADSWPDDPENGLDRDLDGLDNYTERTVTNTDPGNNDSDRDYLTDGEEALTYHTNPLNPRSIEAGQTVLDFFAVGATTDSDGDGIPDKVEQSYATTQPNTTIWLEPNGDLDGDGVTNLQAYNLGWNLVANLNQYDQDGDGVTDVLEDRINAGVVDPATAQDLRPAAPMDKTIFADAVGDLDGDGLLNIEEIRRWGTDYNGLVHLLSKRGTVGSNPRSANRSAQWIYDWDAAKWQDDVARADFFSTPGFQAPQSRYQNMRDDNHNGHPDGYDLWVALVGYVAVGVPVQPAGDVDGDGMSDVFEHRYGFDLRNPADAGLPTGVMTPAVVSSIDADGDGLSNLREFLLDTNPRIADSDGDGDSDGVELAVGSDPNNRSSTAYGQLSQLATTTQQQQQQLLLLEAQNPTGVAAYTAILELRQFIVNASQQLLELSKLLPPGQFAALFPEISNITDQLPQFDTQPIYMTGRHSWNGVSNEGDSNWMKYSVNPRFEHSNPQWFHFDPWWPPLDYPQLLAELSFSSFGTQSAANMRWLWGIGAYGSWGYCYEGMTEVDSWWSAFPGPHNTLEAYFRPAYNGNPEYWEFYGEAREYWLQADWPTNSEVTRSFVKVTRSGNDPETAPVVSAEAVTLTIGKGKVISNVVTLAPPADLKSPYPKWTRVSLLPVEIEWNAPLEEWKDVSGRENEAGRYTSITVKAPAPLNTIEKLREAGLKLRMFSKANKLSGTPVNVDLFDEADFLYNTNGGTVIATFKPDTLERIGILLANERDNINEFATCDTALPTDTSSNWTDSDNFASNILAYGYHERGKARGEGNGGLPGTRPNNFTEYGKLEAKANNQFLKQGGVDFIRFELTKDGATVAASDTRQIRDQADWFYYSGHGHHNNAKLMTLDEEIGPGDVKWDKDMDVAIIAGCSVLDIKDYRAQSFGVLKYAEWLGKGGAWSPGAQWEPTGPKYFLGYCYSAPLDTQGAATIASHFSGLIQSGYSIQDAWKSANDNANGRNACLINLNTSPPTYSYWDETSGSPVWTTVSKGATGW